VACIYGCDCYYIGSAKLVRSIKQWSGGLVIQERSSFFTGLAYILSGIVALVLVGFLGLVLISSSGNCDYCTGPKYVLADVLAIVGTFSGFEVSVYLIFLGWSLIFPSSDNKMQDRKGKFKRLNRGFLLLLILSYGAYFIMGYL
jgi:hypothetical protein